jgi:hypothetical protein
VNIAKLDSFGYFHFLIDEMSKFVLTVKMNSERPRPIIARFLYYSDLDKAKKAERNLRGTYFGVNEQFPPEIEERRRKLYPIMKEEKKKKSKVVIQKSSNDGTWSFCTFLPKAVNIAKLDSFGYFHFLIDEMSKFVFAVFISLLIQPCEYQVIYYRKTSRN